MTEPGAPAPEQVEALFQKLDREAEAAGYHLNPDLDFTRELCRGLLINEARYGYLACPCRLASGNRAQDLDMICPCDYRDPDLSDYGACYCALYVSPEIKAGQAKAKPIPDRREEALNAKGSFFPPETAAPGSLALSHPVWRCKVCGYLAARDNPPDPCPICKARKDRFELFISKG